MQSYLANRFKSNRSLLAFTSIPLQYRVIQGLAHISSVFEVGPAEGTLAYLLRCAGYKYVSADVNPLFNPDYIIDISSYDNIPRDLNADIACFFQGPEHLPLDKLLPTLKNLKSVANRYVFISLPDARLSLNIISTFSLFSRLKVFVSRIFLPWLQSSFPKIRKTKSGLDQYNPHYFEIGRGVSISGVNTIAVNAGLTPMNVFSNPLYPYHIFFLYSVNS